MALVSMLSGLSFLAKDRTLFVHVIDESTGHSQTFPYNLAKQSNNPTLSRADLFAILNRLTENGKVYMATDTYGFLTYRSHPFIGQDQVAGVFPWADRKGPCTKLPNITPYTDSICRFAAYYYWNLQHHQIRDWTGNIRSFEHRAANTLSFRSYASYQTQTKEKRKLISPVDPNASVLQFDWQAAEWSLILQQCGYPLPDDDPYSELTVQDRELTKKIVLPFIYGQNINTLLQIQDESSVLAVIRQIEKIYPNVLQWKEQIKQHSTIDFQGFQIDLGTEDHKKPNYFAQTALQLCKWEKLQQITQVGGHELASGDIHDQLFFDISAHQVDTAQAIIETVKKPSFGSIQLRPQFTAGHTWS